MTFLTRKALTRRTMLKGMGASVALPLLDSMMPALSAQKKRVDRVEAGAHAAWVCLRGARRHPFGVEAASDGPPVRAAAQPATARRCARSLQYLHEPVASRSRQQGRWQWRSQPRLGGVAHRRARLRPHAAGRRDSPRALRPIRLLPGIWARTAGSPRSR